MLKGLKYAFLLIFLLLLAACSAQTDTKEKVNGLLNEMSKNEQSFNESFENIKKMETTEKTLVDEIMKINIKKTDELKQKSNEAIKLANARKDIIQISRGQLDEIIDLLDNFDLQKHKANSTTKVEIKEILSLDNNRLTDIKLMVDTYLSNVDEEIELYKMLPDKNSEIIEKQMLKVKSAYDFINEKQTEIEIKTEELNKKKIILNN